MHTEYYKEARKLDVKFNETMEGDKGPVEEELLKYGQKGKVAGLVAGNYGEVSEALKQLEIFAKRSWSGRFFSVIAGYTVQSGVKEVRFTPISIFNDNESTVYNSIYSRLYVNFR